MTTVQQVKIHFLRPGQPEVVYTEGLVGDDGRRLRTCSVVPAEFRLGWSERWRRQGLLEQGRTIHTVRKYHFYQETFDILEFRDEDGGLLGYYSDIVTPLRRVGREYYLTDLFLDLWLAPDGAVRELDWDEFEAAANAGLISPEQQQTARRTLDRLKQEIAAGHFPGVYIL